MNLWRRLAAIHAVSRFFLPRPRNRSPELSAACSHPPMIERVCNGEIPCSALIRTGRFLKTDSPVALQTSLRTAIYRKIQARVLQRLKRDTRFPPKIIRPFTRDALPVSIYIPASYYINFTFENLEYILNQETVSSCSRIWLIAFIMPFFISHWSSMLFSRWLL